MIARGSYIEYNHIAFLSDLQLLYAALICDTP